MRPGKKLLVLDIDYTLFDHRSVGQNGQELMRPYLHEFLLSAYVVSGLIQLTVGVIIYNVQAPQCYIIIWAGCNKHFILLLHSLVLTKIVLNSFPLMCI